MPIVIAPLDTELKIVRIAADEKLKKHLESKIKDGRIALDSDLSAKIFVA